FDTDSPPDVGLVRRKSELGLQQIPQPFRAFGEDLVGVPVCELHDTDDGKDVIVWHILVEQVAHRVNKDHLRGMPTQWLGKFLGDKSEVEPLLVRVTWDSPETLSERFGIAVNTTWTDLCAPSDRVPGCIGPLDC